MIGPESFLNGELSSHVLSCTFQKMCNFFLNRYSCCVYRGQGKLFCLRNLTYCPGFQRAKSYCIYIHSNLDIVNKFVRHFLFTILNNSLYIKCNMLSKSSKWGLGFVHYMAKFTILRFVISRFECICNSRDFIFTYLCINWSIEYICNNL